MHQRTKRITYDLYQEFLRYKSSASQIASYLLIIIYSAVIERKQHLLASRHYANSYNVGPYRQLLKIPAHLFGQKLSLDTLIASRSGLIDCVITAPERKY